MRADASFKSVGSGSIDVVDFRAPRLAVTTTDGRIRLNDIAATRLNATGGDGRIEGSALLVRDGNVESDGRISLGFAAEADTRVTAETSDGTVRIAGSRDGPTASSSQNKAHDDHPASQTLRLGNGNGRLNVHSSDGNITLSQNL